MNSHPSKVFFINSDLCTPGTFIVPGSVQHTPVVIFSLCILILPSYHGWKVFFINSVLCTSGTFIVPGSVQHYLLCSAVQMCTFLV
jgi:hypothetical protein